MCQQWASLSRWISWSVCAEQPASGIGDGRVKVIACIEDPDVIEKILQHLAKKESPEPSVHAARGPPDQAFFL